MNQFISKSIFLIAFFLGVTSYTTPVYAYIGPGLGLSAIGTLFALVLGILIAIIGFIWYPLKRLIKGKEEDSEIMDKEAHNKGNSNTQDEQ